MLADLIGYAKLIPCSIERKKTRLHGSQISLKNTKTLSVSSLEIQNGIFYYNKQPVRMHFCVQNQSEKRIKTARLYAIWWSDSAKNLVLCSFSKKDP